MILIDKPKLQFLLRGRDVTIDLPADKRIWRKGHDYAAGVRHNRRICRVQVLQIRHYIDGHDQARVALTVHRAETDEPRLLGKKGGYVTNPAAALPDEPEAVDERTQSRITELSNARDRLRRSDPLQVQRDNIAKSLELMREHLETSPNRDVLKTVRALEHQLRSLERKIKAA